jgi:hypothetical protein
MIGGEGSGVHRSREESACEESPMYMFFLSSPFHSSSSRKKSRIRVAVLRTFPPLYLLDHGRPSGLAIEILSEVARMSGFGSPTCPSQNWSEALDALRSG